MSEMFFEKYEYVARRTSALNGKLLDIGARDCILEKYLQSPALQYVSADILPGHDYQIDLEKPLELGDGEFDVVVVLDVLEHLENPHQALSELLRITKTKLFISLPNMACLSFRLKFFREGKLSDKYALLPIHQGDRHRWLTVYDQARTFISDISSGMNCTVIQYDINEDPGNYGKFRFLIPYFLLTPNARVYTMVFEITKP
jgi:SAM-dependent methyltransferase